MESEPDLRETLRGADRAAAAPWIDYPPTPRWYFVGVGVWAALFVWIIVALRHHTIVYAVAIVLMVVGEVATVAWYRRYRGALPHGRPPREVAIVIGWYFSGVVLIAAAVIAATLVSLIFGMATAFVLATAGAAWYEVAYLRAVERVRSRLG